MKTFTSVRESADQVLAIHTVGRESTPLHDGEVVDSEGNGNIVNTATLTSAYHSDFTVQRSTKYVLSTSAPTVEPSEETPTGEPTADAKDGLSGSDSSPGTQFDEGEADDAQGGEG
ncbi:hypothetical protein [Arthrobacter sp. H35-D1]|uniref:hypothetical protein n=1 Tax=Arthrobacter sp. H35-D1 TaxID=3046202 RepID=UPI0024BBA277|nr:hypothetical protein [Arthrobacter sp. H35-D1]MDJ0312573.1 hypothetical protein [Arthrobacter sp. H35-D1]